MKRIESPFVLRALFFVLLGAFLAQPVQGQKPIIVNQTLSIHEFDADELLVLRDTSAALQFSDILKEENQVRFQPPKNQSLNFGYTEDVIWLKFRVQVEEHPNTMPLVELEFPILKSLTFFDQNATGEWNSYETGNQIPFSHRKIKHRHFIFQLNLSDTTNTYNTYYLKINSETNIVVPLFLKTTEALQEQDQFRGLLYGFFYGVMLIMAIYNFIIYLSLRHITYLYYTLSILTSLLAQATLSGHAARWLWGDSVYWINTGGLLFICFGFLFTLIFSDKLLNLEQRHKRLHQLFMGAVLVSFLSAVASIVASYSVASQIVSLLTITAAPFLLFSGIWSWYRGNTAARFFVIAWVAYLLGLVIYTLRTFGLIPSNFWVQHSISIGATLEVVLLSFALADRYRVLRAEKEKAIKEAFDIKDQANRELEEKVKERTASINERNEELSQINEELDTTLHTVQLQSKEIQVQNKEIQARNMQINASINYAKRIQLATLPNLQSLKKYLSDAFVLYRPRDVVSGDFYYVYRQGEKTVLAVADCTGHGVPGAFVSMMCINLIERVFLEKEHCMPNEAIYMLSQYLTSALVSNQANVRDGMDLALCLINHKEQVIYFAGAKNPLVLVREGKPIRYKGSKMSIEGMRRIEWGDIALYEIPYQPGDRFFMYSDGYQDQFGGKDNRRFFSTRFRQLLAESSQLTMEQQVKILEETLENWISVAGEKQTDDILVVGFEP